MARRVKKELNKKPVGARSSTNHVPDPVELPPLGYTDPRVTWILQKLEPGTKIYKMGQCSVFLSRTDEAGWHLSIAHPRRYPSWDEIAHARYKLIPNEATMALLLPPEEEYVNAYEPVFQMIEVFQDPARGRIIGARWVKLTKFEPGQPFETKTKRRAIKLSDNRQDTPTRVVCVDCANGDLIHFDEDTWVKPLKV